MFGKCTICLEDFSETVSPYSTRCGHLFCERCSNTVFDESHEKPCPVCRTKQYKASLVKIFLNFDTEDESEDDELERADEIVGAGFDLVEHDLAGPSVNPERVKSVIQRVTRLANTVKKTAGDSPDYAPLLKTLGHVTSDIRTRLHDIENNLLSREEIEQKTVRDIKAVKDQVQALRQKRVQDQERHATRLAEKKREMKTLLMKQRLLEEEYENLVTQHYDLQSDVATLRDKVRDLERYKSRYKKLTFVNKEANRQTHGQRSKRGAVLARDGGLHAEVINLDSD